MDTNFRSMVEPYRPNQLTEQLYWIEPEYKDPLVAVVVGGKAGDRKDVFWHSPEGTVVKDWGQMLSPLKAEFRRLADALHVQADNDRYRNEVVFIAYVRPLQLAGDPPHFVIRHAAPLLDWCFMQDSVNQGLRALALEQVMPSNGRPRMKLIPSTFIGKPDSPRALTSNYPAAFQSWATQWGVENLMLVARDIPVGADHAVMRYTPSKRVTVFWKCFECAKHLPKDETAQRAVAVDRNDPVPLVPACIRCGTLANQPDEDDDL